MQENNETFRQYGQVLEKTMSHLKNDQQQAEKTLKQMMVTPGFGIISLRFLTIDANPQLKQASAVYFKNMVKEHWEQVSGQDKAQIKNIILPFLLSGPPAKLRVLLSEAVTLIARQDFPQNWTNLVQDLVARANSQDYNVLVGVLRVAHSVFRRYRNVSSSVDVVKELKFILEQFQRPLMAIYMQTWTMVMQNSGDANRLPLLLEALNLCAKLFYDLNYVDLPEFFEDNMKPWMNGFLQAITLKSQVKSVLGDDERPGVLHKLQKNVCMALALYSTKYDEEFAGYLEGFVQAVWQLLTDTLAANASKYDGLVAHGVAFLSSVANGAHNKLFANGNIMKSICEKIVIPCMMLRDEDVELFEDDPMEYVRQDIEGSDLDTRRRSARELVKGLRKNFESEVTQIFGSYIQTLLGHYKSNPKGNWKAKDVAVFLLTAVTVSTYRQATGANSVNVSVPLLPFYQENVFPDLHPQAHPVLQADALKFVITFRSQLPPAEYSRLLPVIATMLKAKPWVVHTYAAYALESMLTVRDKNPNGPGHVHRVTKEQLEPALKDLFAALFGVFQANQQKPNSYVMRAIMRVISRSKEKVGPVVPFVLENLAMLLRNIIMNPQSPVFNHFLFESIGALIGCASAAGGPKAVASLEGSVMPMFQTILQQDIQEFSGYVFQLLAQILSEHKDGVPESFWNMFQALLMPVLWDRPSNVPALVRLLSHFCRLGGQKIATNEQWMGSLLGVWQHLNSVPKYDGDSFELLGAITDNMPLQVLDNFLARILSFVFARLSAERGKTPRYIKGFVTWVLQFTVKHGGSAIISRCNNVQNNIFGNVVNLIGQSINKPRSPGDKKRCALGAIKLLTATDQMLQDPYVQYWGPLLLSLMGLFELPEEEESDGGVFDEAEITGGAVFTPLFHAGMTTDVDPYPGVVEKTELAKGLAALNQKMGGKVPDMVQKALPPEAGMKLQQYFAAAKIRM